LEVIVKCDEIKSLATEASNYSEQLADEIKKIRNIIDNIGMAWNAADAKRYSDVVREKYILGLEALKEVIDEYVVYLNNIPEAYELLDDIYANKPIGSSSINKPAALSYKYLLK